MEQRLKGNQCLRKYQDVITKKQYQILGFLGGEHKILGSDGDIKLVCLIIILSPEY
jgi:hypothetical protein